MNTLTTAVSKMTRTEANILARYAAGEPAAQIVAATGADHGTVCLALDALAGNNRDRAQALAAEWNKRAQAVAAARGPATAPQPAPPAAPTKPAATFREQREAYEQNIDGIADMLDAAEKSGNAKLERTAGKIREQLTALQSDLADHSREARLRQEQVELEARLAEIRAQLKPKRAAATPVDEPAAADPKAIRAWAAENGFECPAKGRVPRGVVAAYRKAVES